VYYYAVRVSAKKKKLTGAASKRKEGGGRFVTESVSACNIFKEDDKIIFFPVKTRLA